MTKIRVLFVDDEPMVLRALRNVLRVHRDRWDMVFVEGAEAALAELAKAPFDVVVSDMRMPRVDGAELLRLVVERWPSTTRLLLSGYADEASMQRAQQVAHRCLMKPCDYEVLRDAIEGAARAA